MFLAEFGMFAFVMVLFTATQRAVLRPTERGFAFLRFGGDELRLIGLGLFLTVCLYLGMFVAMIAIVIAVAIVGVASGSPAVTGLLILIGFLALTGATIYVEVRISLAFPLTFLRRSFIVGEAWRLSRGRFWTLFGAYFLIGLVYTALAGILLWFAVKPLFSELAQTGNSPEAFQLAIQHQMERFVRIDASSAALWLGAALVSGITLALFGGAVATAARDLIADGQDMAAPPA